MKSIKLIPSQPATGTAFHIARLGLHEVMPPCIVDRPEGTGDYLFMLFHDPMTVRTGRKTWEVSNVPAYSLMIWTPKDGHFYGNTDYAWNHSWFHCTGRAIGPLLKANRLPIHQTIELGDPSLMEKCLLDFVAELSGWRRPDERILYNIFEIFVRGVARQIQDKTGQLAPACLLKVRTHLDQNFVGTTRLMDLAKMAGWSVPHLCTEFKRFFGASILQYILHLRMNQAAYFLRDQNRRIGEIAPLVGYSDPFTFSKTFKRHFGVSPRMFRLGQTGKRRSD